MKIIVIGGAGDMGSRAVEDLTTCAGVSGVTICDRNERGAAEIAKRFQGRSAKVEVAPVDANDHAALVKTIQGHDVAASALGPFYAFEAKLVRASIEARVNYCSICDEWEPAEMLFDQFHQQAVAQGVKIVTGLGASPGLTNIVISRLAQELDTVHRARAALYLPINCGGGRAVLEHAAHIMSGQTVVWRNGRRALIPACSEQQDIEFPRFGRIRTWNMGHSEPVTVPRYLTDLRDMEFFMGFDAGAPVLVQLARWGLFDGRCRTEFAVRAMHFIEQSFFKSEPGLGAMRVDAWGLKNGRETHLMRCGTGLMREITGLSLSVGALMLGQGALLTDQAGVYAPEGILDPCVFLEHFKCRGIQAYADLEMTKPMT